MSPAIISRFSTGRQIPFSFPSLASHHPRQLLISGMIALWAGRLGYYLFGVSLLLLLRSLGILYETDG